MPIPKPHKGESKDKFMGRCMGMLANEDKPQDQKVAICFSQWRESHGEDKPEAKAEEEKKDA